MLTSFRSLSASSHFEGRLLLLQWLPDHLHFALLFAAIAAYLLLPPLAHSKRSEIGSHSNGAFPKTLTFIESDLHLYELSLP